MQDNISLKEFVIKLFTSQSGISSKRVFGSLGWLVCLFTGIYCTLLNQQAPIYLDTLVIASTALLGVDSITGIWKKPN